VKGRLTGPGPEPQPQKQNSAVAEFSYKRIVFRIIARRLKQVRLDSKISLNEISRMLTVSVDFMKKFEDGTKIPSFEVVLALCEIYGIPSAYFMLETDQQPVPVVYSKAMIQMYISKTLELRKEIKHYETK